MRTQNEQIGIVFGSDSDNFLTGAAFGKDGLDLHLQGLGKLIKGFFSFLPGLFEAGIHPLFKPRRV